MKGAKERGLTLRSVGEFEAITGMGVVGSIDGTEVALGNERLLSKRNIETGELGEAIKARQNDGETVMFVVIDKKAAGLIAVADPIKETTPAALKALRDAGLRILMA